MQFYQIMVRLNYCMVYYFIFIRCTYNNLVNNYLSSIFLKCNNIFTVLFCLKYQVFNTIIIYKDPASKLLFIWL